MRLGMGVAALARANAADLREEFEEILSAIRHEMAQFGDIPPSNTSERRLHAAVTIAVAMPEDARDATLAEVLGLIAQGGRGYRAYGETLKVVAVKRTRQVALLRDGKACERCEGWGMRIEGTCWRCGGSGEEPVRGHGGRR